MKIHWLYLSAVSMALGLTGCSSITHKYENFRNNHEAYHPTAESVPPTKGIDQQQVSSNYQVKPLQNPSQVQTASIVPPGSNLEKPAASAPAKTATATTTQPSTTTPSSTSPAKQTYVVAGKYNDVWKKVGVAIKKANYQLLDQDSGLGTYYVLDTSVTSGKINETTPIYQLHLTQVPQGIQLSLLNSQSEPASADVTQRILGAVMAQMPH